MLRTTAVGLVLLSIALGVLALVGLGARSVGSRPMATASEYCVDQGPIYVGGKQVFSGGHYCVPGP